MDKGVAPKEPSSGLPLRVVILALIIGLVVMQAGLWAFLGLPLWWFAAGGVLLISATVGLARMPGWRGSIPWRDMILCIAVAALVLALGGEGRLTYANTDWQVRLAVLRDMTINPWPFAYDVAGGPTVLRAPLGMYLIPALAGKWMGGAYAAELALWLQNSLLLSLTLAAGSALFTGGRAKLIGLGVFLGFSGMDIIGQAMAGQPLMLHLEQWVVFQFSAHITQMFWVPQHGLAGWIFAAAYLAWQRSMAPKAVLAVMLPLLALLSPLSAVGCVPFAAYACLRKGMIWRDMGWPVLTGIAALPGLLYLIVAGDSVGASAVPVSFATYPIFILLEIGAYLLALRLRPDAGSFGAATAWITVGSLLIIPFGRIGNGMDFAMRASIPALAILAVMVGDIIARATQDTTWRPAARVALLAWAVGLATPLGEIGRALAWPRAPAVDCGYYGVVPGGYATYIAPLSRFPTPIRPDPTLIKPQDPARCWQGAWPDAVDGRDVQTHPGRE